MVLEREDHNHFQWEFLPPVSSIEQWPSAFKNAETENLSVIGASTSAKLHILNGKRKSNRHLGLWQGSSINLLQELEHANPLSRDDFEMKASFANDGIQELVGNTANISGKHPRMGQVLVPKLHLLYASAFRGIRRRLFRPKLKHLPLQMSSTTLFGQR